MGKTNKSITQQIFSITDEEMDGLYDALDQTDQLQLWSIFKHMTKYKLAIGNARPLRFIEVVCILMLLVVYKRTKKLFHMQYEELRLHRKALENAGLLQPAEMKSLEDDDTEEEVNLLEMLVQHQTQLPQ